MFYDPDKDQSEKFGWKKWSEERQPTDEEQDLWGKWSLIIIAKFTALGFILQY